MRVDDYDDEETDIPPFILLWIIVMLGLSILMLGIFGEPREAAGQNYDFTVSSQPALSNTAVVIKASPGPVLWFSCYNPNAAALYLQLYDATAAVVVGTTAPSLTLPLPPGPAATGFRSPRPANVPFAAGLGIQAAVTTTATGGVAPGMAVSCDFAYR